MSFKRKKQWPMEKSINTKVCQSKSNTEVAHSIPFKNYNSKVNLFASRCRIRNINRTKAQISKYHILESGNKGQEICRKILDTHIGLDQCYRNLNLDNVMPTLSPILELFKNQHNRFNYFDKLKWVLAKGSEICAKQKCKNQIHVHLMQTFFKILLYKIVPMELFGTVQNLKVLRNTINHLLKTVPSKITIKEAFRRTLYKKDAIGASLNIQALLKRFDISTIKWLHSIEDNTKQWIIILKLLHWFFAQYIVKILHKYVVLISVKKQWVYITKDDWCRMQEEFINEKKSIGTLIPWIPSLLDESEQNTSIGSYKFIPSSSGLRALFLLKYNIKEKLDDIDVILRFLQQLYVTYLNKEGLPTVTSCQKNIDLFKKSIKEQLYYVRCDIRDAFGSIEQEKLYDIIKKYCTELSIYLRVRTYTLSRHKKNYKNNRQNKVHKTQTVQFLELNKSLKNIIRNEEKPRLVRKTKLLAKIRRLIFQQKVKLNDHVYLIKRGVPQGLPVSPILSDIYYQHMIKEILSKYTSEGLLCTYVDDMLYITQNKDYATKFLKLVRNGISDYNVKFNPGKIESNIDLPCKFTKIKFLGRFIQF